MNITTKNYFAIVKSIGVEKMPPVLKQAHAAISEKRKQAMIGAITKEMKTLNG